LTIRCCSGDLAVVGSWTELDRVDAAADLRSGDVDAVVSVGALVRTRVVSDCCGELGEAVNCHEILQSVQIDLPVVAFRDHD